MNEVCTIIVTHNAMKWSDRCFSSLINSIVKQQIIVVDNASTDGTKQYLKKHFPEVHLIENKFNIGFGRANNQAIDWALRNGVKYVFLLNQDAWINPDTISILLQNATDNKEWGLLSPKHLNPQNQDLEKSFQFYLTNDCSIKAQELFHKHYDQNDSVIIPFNFVNAAAWFIPVATLKEIGGFDSMFFYTGEDTDFANRLRYHKMKIGVCPSAIIYHDSGDYKKLLYNRSPQLYRISKKADALKTLKNINNSFIYALLKTYYYMGVDLLQSIGRIQLMIFHFKLILQISANLRAVYHIRNRVKQKGRHFLFDEHKNSI